MLTKKNKKASGGILIVMLILAIGVGAYFYLSQPENPHEQISNTRIITCLGQNSSSIITENIFDTEASIKTDALLEDTSNIDFVYPFYCKTYQDAFFKNNEEYYNNHIKAWNQMDITMNNENGIDIGDPEYDFLAGYTVTEVKINFKDKSTQETVVECLINGNLPTDVGCNHI